MVGARDGPGGHPTPKYICHLPNHTATFKGEGGNEGVPSSSRLAKDPAGRWQQVHEGKQQQAKDLIITILLKIPKQGVTCSKETEKPN